MPKQIQIRNLDEELYERICGLRENEGLTWPEIGRIAFERLLEEPAASPGGESAPQGDIGPGLDTGPAGGVFVGKAPQHFDVDALADLMAKAPAPPVLAHSPRIAPDLLTEYLRRLYQFVPALQRQGPDYIARVAAEDVETLAQGDIPTSTRQGAKQGPRTGLLRKAVAT